MWPVVALLEIVDGGFGINSAHHNEELENTASWAGIVATITDDDEPWVDGVVSHLSKIERVSNGAKLRSQSASYSVEIGDRLYVSIFARYNTLLFTIEKFPEILYEKSPRVFLCRTVNSQPLFSTSPAFCSEGVNPNTAEGQAALDLLLKTLGR